MSFTAVRFQQQEGRCWPAPILFHGPMGPKKVRNEVGGSTEDVPARTGDVATLLLLEIG